MFRFIDSAAKYSVLTLLLCFLAGCTKEYRTAEGMIWNTTYHITYEADKDLSDSIVNELNQVGVSLNVFDPNSLVSRVNGADSVEIDHHFREVYDMSVRVNRISNGAFDPTLAPLITAWGFGKGHKATADTLRIDSLLSITGIAKTHIADNRLIKQDPRISFNFSAVAKGYGCDRVAEMLKRNGVANYLVEIGGEIACAGVNSKNGKWRVSIDKPIRSDSITHESQCIVALSDAGMATSGNYRNFHSSGGRVYGHTISSTTGRPVKTDVISASVVATTAMEADALATALMAMDRESAESFAAGLDLPILLIFSDMSVLETPRFTSLAASEP